MRFWGIVWIVVIAIVGAFSLMNWRALMAPVALDFIIAQVTAPLGIAMLGAMVVLTLLYLFFLVWLETKALLRIGRAGGAGDPKAMSDVNARLEHVEQVLTDDVSRAIDALTAQVDRLERQISRSE
jgi:hypothetical protein